MSAWDSKARMILDIIKKNQKANKKYVFLSILDVKVIKNKELWVKNNSIVQEIDKPNKNILLNW